MLGFLFPSGKRRPVHTTTAVRQDGREGNRRTTHSSSSANGKNKRPSLFAEFHQQQEQAKKDAAAKGSSSSSSAPPPSSFLSSYLDEDDEYRRRLLLLQSSSLTYVGFSSKKIRQELFQSWLSDQPDYAQFRAADLVASGAVDAVFQELVRIACLCAPTCPRLLVEAVRTRGQLCAHFLARQQSAKQSSALGPGFGLAGVGGGCGVFGASPKKRKRKAAAAAAAAWITGQSGGGGRGGGGADKSAAGIQWIEHRNDPGLRRPIARLVLLAYLAVDDETTAAAAFAPPPFVPQDEYVRARLEQRVQADRGTWAQAVLRRGDPPGVVVATNELVYHLAAGDRRSDAAARRSPAGQRRLHAVCYWMLWLTMRVREKGGVVCAEREQFCGGRKLATHPVWIVWDALYYAARDGGEDSGGGPGGPSTLALLDILSAEFQRGYQGSSVASIKQRMHLLYCAASLVLFGAAWSAPLVCSGGDEEEDFAADLERRIDYDADTVYRFLRLEKAKVDAAKAAEEEEEHQDGF